MQSKAPEKSTLELEVTNISRHGFWLLLEDRELFVPFEKFPWFENAAVASILRVEQPNPGHLYWPDLDVDLAVESIEHPERFPLVVRIQDSPSLAFELGEGEFRLSESYLAAISRIEALPQNQSGSDKTWVELTFEESRQHFAKAIRVS